MTHVPSQLGMAMAVFRRFVSEQVEPEMDRPTTGRAGSSLIQCELGLRESLRKREVLGHVLRHSLPGGASRQRHARAI